MRFSCEKNLLKVEKQDLKSGLKVDLLDFNKLIYFVYIRCNINVMYIFFEK